MLATSVRVRPCSARSSPRSVGRVTTMSLSRCSIFIRDGTCCCSVPSGPATATRAGSIVTVTPSGTGMGALPILLTVLKAALHYQMKRASDRHAGRLNRDGDAVGDREGCVADSAHCLKSCTALPDEG